MTTADKHACVRCGLVRTIRQGRAVYPLCVDCKLVAAGLGELHLWTAGTWAAESVGCPS